MVPDAEIILFGSRARGTARPDSDWDVLVIVDAPKLQPVHRDIDYCLWDKGQQIGQEINTIVRTAAQWAANISFFKKNVLRDGIKL